VANKGCNHFGLNELGKRVNMQEKKSQAPRPQTGHTPSRQLTQKTHFPKPLQTTTFLTTNILPFAGGLHYCNHRNIKVTALFSVF